ncbi:inner membrane protein YiaA [Sphingobacterium sp. LRF_L2]|uniref:inner membrane protein YiaA n=1 Tax=Sphingobacterium sp. LRF_L2 TaxID=3369421 RepID=UPI003F60E27C
MESLKNQIEENALTTKREEKVRNPFKPTGAFIGASWFALLTGTVGYCVGLWNAAMELNEKGYYFTILLFGLFAVISVQKSVRDKSEGLAVTELYYGLSWFATIASIILLVVGLWNANLTLSEKGFYGMSFTLSIFSAIAVQKNTRDAKMFDEKEI